MTTAAIRLLVPHSTEDPAPAGPSIARPRSIARWPLRWLATLCALGSGIVNLWSVLGPGLPERIHRLQHVFPLEFVQFSRFAVLLAGFALVVSSLNLYRRKRRAFHFVVVLSALSVVLHLTKGIDYEEALLSAILLGLLLLGRRDFTVGSGIPSLRQSLMRLAAAIATAFIYGVAGFWLLDKREFGINFTIGDAIHRTFLFLSLAGDPGIVARTRYAHWFVDSLYLITGTALVYSVWTVFRPVVYRYRTLPQEREAARTIAKAYGRSSLEYFKYWRDKSFFFSPSRQCFISYRVGAGCALVLGDPVGPEQEIESTVQRFCDYCVENDWRVAFHQTLPDFLPAYRKLGFRKLKVGDEAIVELPQFSLEGKHFRKLRARNVALEKEGIRFERYGPHISNETMAQLKEVSDAWLEIPGRRERTFTVGLYDPGYIRETPVYAAVDGSGAILAFVNLIPSFAAGEATIDLMRHRASAPSGMMDYLFTNLFLECKAQGFTRFNLGMAPMSGFQEHEEASPEERAVIYFVQQMNFLFSYKGLRQYKAKFASKWEPRYLIYRNVLHLPRIARAIAEVAEIHA